ncbi:TIGR02996 domain-containing protein [Gemmata sp. G18]|uniref:TIGR02996 domain-containing protein n=1 Tax=Gemmata palustris TaxID=2822762 RepID=A0ABS5C2J6_9BACT|nr:TIGR02996 domain-containing protein [Gemmata palustris]MBP3960202.1 TIGR02996 domain-containing protein [Gemmata palustris]
MSDAAKNSSPAATESVETAPSFPALTAEDRVFLRALVDTPEDRTTWLVYADWFEDRGDPRAEFLRLIVDRDLMPGGDPLVTRADARLAHLRNELDPLWLAAFDPAPVMNCSGMRSEGLCVWTELTATDAPDIRLCYGCLRPVFYCCTPDEAALIRSAGEVIALSTRFQFEQAPLPPLPPSTPPVRYEPPPVPPNVRTAPEYDPRYTYQARSDPPPARPWWKFW